MPCTIHPPSQVVSRALGQRHEPLCEALAVRRGVLVEALEAEAGMVAEEAAAKQEAALAASLEGLQLEDQAVVEEESPSQWLQRIDARVTWARGELARLAAAVAPPPPEVLMPPPPPPPCVRPATTTTAPHWQTKRAIHRVSVH